MALGDAMRARLEELSARAPGLSARIAAIAEGATLQAVDRARELTPPNTFGEDEQRGVNMITGEMAEHWLTDSQTKPTAAADGYMTTLANDMEYASYVNDGHRVDKHFVPGLYIDPATGLLSMDLSKPKGVGLMVGTKTTYVEGLHITEAAEDVYDEVARAELEKLTREVFQ